MRPTLEQIRHFLALERTGSFTAAARQCHISQPPFSRSIQKLESIVGRKLVSRENGMFATTSAGKAFAVHCRDVIALVDEAIRAARKEGEGTRSLRIGLVEYVYHLLRPLSLSDFASKHENLVIEPVDMNYARSARVVLDTDIDLWFEISGSRDSMIPPEGVVSTMIYSEPLVALVPEGSELAGRQSLGLSELATAPLVIFRQQVAPQIYEDTLQCFEDCDVVAEIAMEVTLFESMINAVRGSAYVGLVPHSTSRLAPSGTVLVPISGAHQPMAFLHLLWRRADEAVLYRDFANWIGRTANGGIASVSSADVGMPPPRE